MAVVRGVAAQALPLPGDKYDRIYFNLLIKTLNGFFATVANAINADILDEDTTIGTASGVTGLLDLSAFTGINLGVSQLANNISVIRMPKTPGDGDLLTIRFQQANGGGPFTVTGWPSNLLLGGGGFAMSAGANKYDLLTFMYDATLAIWFEQGRSQNM